ncbi:hypothetical protein URH17368_0244 [Alicyclobacillus hesperidum URH17-3-68]|uniref:YqzL-like protein n=1 Tax=Alicyclobacillus hesperidum TaxID=89784 RepID=A0A1H2UAA0_9BACL|nr:YqzL family protein [Alicyclobacillus hesperidum]EJY57059.1 hypothetical protein URH17368_0244 [Alicyclobacillus hesperidum URH17-3-68]GLG00296.1 hypothetical protein Alches_03350 [Alicyclobacillus hesperidum subsp. aegles]GLV14124.1 hypothetical protein Heshes_18080 [Alicyclobacillus hesperidum]SDW52374.1 YqzL-like protein [Alicyclobacillus hesperidum]
MRDITWQMFELTGDIDAYLLYRACEQADLTGDDVRAANDVELEEESHFPPS